jgi:hypothetical protein
LSKAVTSNDQSIILLSEASHEVPLCQGPEFEILSAQIKNFIIKYTK